MIILCCLVSKGPHIKNSTTPTKVQLVIKHDLVLQKHRLYAVYHSFKIGLSIGATNSSHLSDLASWDPSADGKLVSPAPSVSMLAVAVKWNTIQSTG